MKKLISNWFEFIFGLKLKNKRTYFIEEKPNIRTTYPNLQIGFNEWAQEFKVSQLYQR